MRELVDNACTQPNRERIVELLENEWGLTEDTELDIARKEKDRLTAMARKAGK